MPTYEYFCKECQQHWEEEQSITEPALIFCQNCQKDTAIRLISAGTGFILQGGGWYREGYSK